ncbi:MAG: sialidase family protein [Chloroflexota bacterium]
MRRPLYNAGFYPLILPTSTLQLTPPEAFPGFARPLGTATPLPGVLLTGVATIIPAAREDKTVSSRVIQAPTSFTVTAAPAWASLGQLYPLWSAWGGVGGIVADPRNPRRLAYCGRHGIRRSVDSGVHWSAIALTGVLADLAAHYPQPGGPRPSSCASFALDPDHPQSLFVTFGLGVPMSGVVAYQSRDGGASWQPTPAPAGFAADQFGGFVLTGQAIQARFGGAPAAYSRSSPVAVEQTTDGGRTWTPAQLTCPGAGPCLRWGPAPYWWSMGAAMPQAIEVSTDGGATWGSPIWPRSVDVGHRGPSELVALSATSAALLSSGSRYPLRVSHDGGRIWRDVALPASPGLGTSFPQDTALQLLPNGALLATTYGGPPRLLLPGAEAWCSVRRVTLPMTLPQVIGSRLWWLQPVGRPITSVAPRSIPLADLQCMTR